MPDLSKRQNWREERDDLHEIQGIVCAAIVGLSFWAVVIGFWVA